MHPLSRCLIAVLTGVLMAACAGGPPQPQVPRHVRQATYYLNKGIDLFNKGCYPRALDYFQNAHQRYTAMDDQAGVAMSLNNIADIYFRIGDMQSALRVYDDAAEVNRSQGDTAGEVRALSNRAAALIDMDRLDEAARTLDQADDLATDDEHEALRLKTRALLLIRQNDLDKARSLLARALAASRGEDGPMASSIHYAIGHVTLLSGQPEGAVRSFEKALALDQEANAYFDIASDLSALGQCHAAMGDHATAVNLFKRSAKIFALLKAERETADVVDRLERSAANTDADLDATRHWVAQWLTHENKADLCR